MEDNLSKRIGILDDRFWHTGPGLGKRHEPLHINLGTVIDGLMLWQRESQAKAQHLNTQEKSLWRYFFEAEFS